MNNIELKKAVEYMNIVKFGAYLSKLRKEHDMPQSQLAERLNVTRQAVSRWERGEGFPDISILCEIANVFGVSIDMLVNAGEVSGNEAAILTSVSKNQALAKELFEDKTVIEDVINIAPYLKVSTLSEIAGQLSKHNINIGKIIALSEFMSDESIVKLFENSDLETLDDALLERLIPFLGPESIYAIFEKVLKGENSERLIKVLRPYISYSLIETAVMQGVLSYSVLERT
ncbi:MAG: helix-turn-helix domain-containing protein [Eubacteriales bacterium]|jgi:transcriptional regulator with XRE-family HTH domain|nr:helix-turn-helix domain-containing protein [Eubacteriales bacterium]